jgi:hypothetical protein
MSDKRFVKKLKQLWFYYEDASVSVLNVVGLNRRFETFQKQKCFFTIV